MKYSSFFGRTTKTLSNDMKLASHKLLHKAGFVRESTAGRYYFLPLGIKVRQKIMNIIRDEMNRAGAQEIITPVLHPIELWKETNRTESVSFELMRIKDRRGAEFALGGTAEEMLVDLVRKFQVSYKDLPFNLYQFSQKFRDEKRARGGLLRVREFMMKDAYSFHADEKDFKTEYKNMWDTYLRIYNKLGLDAVVVEADNGYIGGDYSHEFQAICPAGEDTLFYVKSKDKYYNKEIAPVQAPVLDNEGEEMLEREDVLGQGIIGVQELADFIKIPVEKTTKTLLFVVDKKRYIAAAVRGGYNINETKLKRITGVQTLELADADVIKKLTGAEVGYLGPLGLPDEVEVYYDESTSNRLNFECGANKTDYHSMNVNWGRDLKEPDKFYDFKEAKEGDLYPETGEKYEIYKSIEVGNIFQLGYYYSKKMKGAEFTDQEGKGNPYYMGCYGIGIDRTMATIVEKYHDDKGLIWPKQVAPFDVHLVTLGEDEKVMQESERVYKELQGKGFDVLWDEREGLGAGEKLGDADLIGIPVRLVVSSRSIDQGGVELKYRDKKDSEVLSMEKLLEVL